MPDANVSPDLVTDDGPSGVAVDDERDLAVDDLPPLGLRWVDVLGNVTAGPVSTSARRSPPSREKR